MSSVAKNPLLRMLRCESVAPLGKPVVPEVYWMLIGSILVESGHSRAQILHGYGVRAVLQVLPVVGVEEQHFLQIGHLVAHLVDHADVIRRLERRGRDEGSDARLLQHVGEFMRPVCGVDVDQDRADLGCRVLHDGPLGTVRCPHTDTVTAFNAEGHETACDHVDFVVQFAVCPSPVACHVNERLVVRMRPRGPLEVLTDRLFDDRSVGRTLVV